MSQNSLAPTGERYWIPAETLIDIMKYVVIQEPIEYGARRRNVRRDWTKLTRVNRFWRQCALGCAEIWADNICAYPKQQAMEVFLERSRTVPITVDLDRLLAGCYKMGNRNSIAWLMQNRGARLKNAKTIKSSLCRFRGTFESFDPLVTALGPDVWFSIFSRVTFDNLTTLVFHVTKHHNFPMMTPCRVQHLEIIGVKSISHVEMRDADKWVSTWKQVPAWLNGFYMSIGRVSRALKNFPMLRTLIFDGVTLAHAASQTFHQEIHLPHLAVLLMCSPYVSQIITLNSLIHAPDLRQLTLISNQRSLPTPTPPLVEQLVRGNEHAPLTMVVEAGHRIRWTTILNERLGLSATPAYADKRASHLLTSERSSPASFHLRAGGVSTLETFQDPNFDSDTFLGLPPFHITHLVIRPLTRMLQNKTVWHAKASEMSFIEDMHALQTVDIMDVRLASDVCARLKSTALKRITIDISDVWQGATELENLCEAVTTAALVSSENVTVSVTGSRRYSDNVIVAQLAMVGIFTTEDRRIISPNFPPEVEDDSLRADQQQVERLQREEQAHWEVLQAMQNAGEE